MGKREHKKWTFSLERSGTLIFMSVLFLAGGLVGCFFSRFSIGAEYEPLGSYLVDYMEIAQKGQINKDFWNTAWNELRGLLLIILFGMTPVKNIGASAVLLFRGFFLTFSFGCLVQIFGVEGVFLGLLLFLMPAFFWGSALFLIVSRVISLSTPFFSDRFWISVCLCAVLLGVCISVEYWLIPALLKIAVHIVL